MEEDAAGAAAGPDAREDEAGLRIHHYYCVSKYVGYIEEMAVRGEADIACEVLGCAVFFGG
jgi:hypothetical protein